MKGCTLLKVTQATLVESMQAYIDKQMPGHKVAALKALLTGYMNAGEVVAELVVEVHEKVEAAETDSQK